MRFDFLLELMKNVLPCEFVDGGDDQARLLQDGFHGGETAADCWMEAIAMVTRQLMAVDGGSAVREKVKDMQKNKAMAAFEEVMPSVWSFICDLDDSKTTFAVKLRLVRAYAYHSFTNREEIGS